MRCTIQYNLTVQSELYEHGIVVRRNSVVAVTKRESEREKTVREFECSICMHATLNAHVHAAIHHIYGTKQQFGTCNQMKTLSSASLLYNKISIVIGGEIYWSHIFTVAVKTFKARAIKLNLHNPRFKIY